ncbi:hypothetical protein FDZ73_17725, partial [bacterium]
MHCLPFIRQLHPPLLISPFGQQDCIHQPKVIQDLNHARYCVEFICSMSTIPPSKTFTEEDSETMKIECPSCHLTGNINSVDVPAEGRNFECPRCKG